MTATTDLRRPSSQPRYLALDIGGSGIKYAVANGGMTLGPRSLLQTCYENHADFIEAVAGIYNNAGPVDAIAISTCGEVDPSTGEMFSGGTLTFNAGQNLRTSIAARCRVPVAVENDANCALIAEMEDGALASCQSGIVLTLGSAVGGAIMINREVFYGSHFHSGNVSFTRTDLSRSDSPDLVHTNGVQCLVDDYLRASGVASESITVEELFARLHSADPSAEAAVKGFAARMAAHVFNLQLVLDVEVVAIGGGVSAQPRLIQSISDHLAGYFDAAPAVLPRPTVVPCQYRNDANLLGALHNLRRSEPRLALASV